VGGFSMSAPSDTAKTEAQGTAKALGLVSIAILCSRVLGLIREALLSAIFAGANLRWLDAFIMAFKAPNMLRDLFAEGALSTAFVTVFTKKTQAEGEAAAWKLARKMLTLASLVMSLISILGVVLAPWIIWALASGWREGGHGKVALSGVELEEKMAFTVLLAQIMYPFILLVSLAALVMGMLNARKVFFMPAMASTFFNVGSMVVGGGVGWWLDPGFGKTAVIGFAIGTLVGGLLQLAVQIPSLKKVGFSFRPDFGFRDPGVSHTLQLMWPAVISGSVVQVSVFMNTFFASHVPGDGPVTWLNSAFRLMQLPLGLFGVGLATVSLPSLARMATNGIGDDFRGALTKALRMGALLSVPSAVGLAVLAWPIMGLIYNNGEAAKNPANLFGCAVTLQTYAVGLVFYSGLKVLQPAFYAIEKRFVPMVVSIICVIFSAGLNWLFVMKMGLDQRYLALSTSLSAALNFGLLFWTMRRHAGSLGGTAMFVTLLKLLLAAGCMAGVCWLGMRYVIDPWWDVLGMEGSTALRLLFRSVLLGSVVAVAAGVYFGTCRFLKNEELDDFVGGLQRKLRKRSA
jgi:putative peptidoglycan lipid II flippase